MTDSIKILEIPIPEDAANMLGFTDEGIYQVDISDGRLVLTQKQKGVCIYDEDDEEKPDCDACTYSCPHCGACNAPQFFRFCNEIKIEQEADCDD